MMKRLISLVPAVRMLFAASVGLGLAGGILIILEAAWLSDITDRAFLGGQALPALLPSMGVLLGWIVLRVLTHMAGELASFRLAARVKHDLRKRLVRKLAELGPQYAKGERSGELTGTLVEGVEQLEVFLSRYIPQAALSALIPAAVLIAVVRLDWTTTAILAVTLPLLILFMILIGVTAKAKAERHYKTLGLLSGHFHDVVRGLPTLQIFNRSKAQTGIIRQISEEHRKTTMGTLRLAFLSAFVMELFATLSTAVVAVFLGLRLISGGIDFHSAYTLLLLTPEFYGPVRALGTQFHAGANGRAAAERIFQVLDAKPLGYSEGKDARIPLGRHDARGHEIELSHVSFQYPGTEAPVLSDLSFLVKPGQRIAVIGHTGAGKSTLLDLLQGFLKPSSGCVTVDGIDMKELSMDWWRSRMAVVAQRPHLFHGTVADNIRFGRTDAGMDEVVEAARRAQADSFIRQLPNGYDTAIGEAVRLSGGQMQRIAIARALLRDAPVLFLDEPTAQLDLENESLVKLAWSELCQDRTVVMAAHRLETVRKADGLIVLQHGRVVEAGRPEDLLQRKGVYASMVRAHSQDEVQLKETVNKVGEVIA